MKVSDYIAAYLARQGVTAVFELVGGMITHLIDSVDRQEGVRLVSMHHEQGAAFAAEGYGRMTGVPGVAMATSGPGATNLLTGIGSCFFDSTPAIFITGQVNRNERKGERAIRQLGFQETDIVSIAAPLTKASWRVESSEEIPMLLDRAFTLALSGRPGPVLLDIPMDVQRERIPEEFIEIIRPSSSASPDLEMIERLMEAIASAQRPLVLAGGGLRSSKATAEFRRFVETLGVPVVHSLMGVDILPYGHPLRVGMIGSYGNRWANVAVDQSDFVLVMGSRLDVRQTGARPESFKGDRVIYHVDCEPGEINNRVTGCRAVISDLPSFLACAIEAVRSKTFPAFGEWKATLRSLRDRWPDISELKDCDGVNPNALMHQLSQASGQAAAYVIDVGQHQMWAAQSIELRDTQRFLTSGGMGAMGFALPSAIGASIGRPDQPIVLIAGDGGFQVNIQELETVKRNQLPLKMVILNNECHGMVRQFQQSYFHERYPSTYWGYSAPSFARVAESYGIEAMVAERADDIPAGFSRLWKNPASPFLLEIKIDVLTNVYPKLAFGFSIADMEPQVKPLEMEGT